MLCEGGVDPGELGEVGILIEGNSNRPGLLSQGLENGLADPPDRVRNEFDTLVRIEFLDRFQEPFVADSHEPGEPQTTALIFFHIRNNESEIGGYESLSGLFVASTSSPGERSLLGRILNKGIFLDVL